MNSSVELLNIIVFQLPFFVVTDAANPIVIGYGRKLDSDIIGLQ